MCWALTPTRFFTRTCQILCMMLRKFNFPTVALHSMMKQVMGHGHSLSVISNITIQRLRMWLSPRVLCCSVLERCGLVERMLA